MALHESDLSNDPAMLKYHIDECRTYIKELEMRLGERGIEVKVCGSGKMPTRTFADDAGFDLYASKSVWIEPQSFTDIEHGVAIELPPGFWAQIVGRSSTLRKRGLLVNPGVLDTGYRGPLFSGVWNLAGKPVRVEQGERVAQLVIMANTTASTTLVRAENLSASERGKRGFGSSGV